MCSSASCRVTWNMKKLTIVFVEIGMLLGIVLAAFTVPRSFPLLTFLIISAGFFVVGNVLLLRKLKQRQTGEFPSDGKVWPHLYRVFIMCGAYGLLCFLLR
jgi:hypothetical protein